MVCELENSHIPRTKEQLGQDRTPRPCPFVLGFSCMLPVLRCTEVSQARRWTSIGFLDRQASSAQPLFCPCARQAVQEMKSSGAAARTSSYARSRGLSADAKPG